MLSRGDDGRVSMWCKAPPGSQAVLVGADPARFFVPPYVGPKGWIGMRLDGGPDWAEVELLVRRSYGLIAPKRLAALAERRVRGAVPAYKAALGAERSTEDGRHGGAATGRSLDDDHRTGDAAARRRQRARFHPPALRRGPGALRPLLPPRGRAAARPFQDRDHRGSPGRPARPRPRRRPRRQARGDGGGKGGEHDRAPRRAAHGAERPARGRFPNRRWRRRLRRCPRRAGADGGVLRVRAGRQAAGRDRRALHRRAEHRHRRLRPRPGHGGARPLDARLPDAGALSRQCRRPCLGSAAPGTRSAPHPGADRLQDLHHPGSART